MDGRFRDFGPRFDEVNRRFDEVDRRITELDRKMDQRFNDVKDPWRSASKKSWTRA